MSARHAALIAIAALAVMAPGMGTGTGTVAASTWDDYQAMRRATPQCRAHPEFPWIGRVSGNTRDSASDERFPVSLVGCFPTQQICETWKQRASTLIDSTIIQYSCKPRN